MRIYNATNAQLDLPFRNGQRLSINPHSVSNMFVGTVDFIKLMSSSYTTDEIAIIVGGPHELQMIADVPVATNYIAQTLDEAIARFNIPAEKEKKVEVVEDKVEDNKEAEVKEEVKEEIIPETKKEESTSSEQPAVTDVPPAAPVKTTKKKSYKKRVSE